MTVFDAKAHADFAAAYPERPTRLDHGLADHPLLKLDALAALARRIRPVDAEYNRGDIPVGIDPGDTPANGLSIEETIRSIEENGSWMVLKFVEQDPLYRALLAETLAELTDDVRPTTGAMLKQEAFIFISSPDAVTPFHFDPEHNILLQIRGRKMMTVFPAADEALADGAQHEAFHNGGHRNLAWRDEFAAKGQPFHLTPGRAVYVPVKAPHWVQNGPEVSISFSITWRSDWSYREEYARRMNAVLRKAGIDPAAPRRYPHQNHAKSLGYRVIDKARRMTGRAG
ncbi:cupin-like domain-containing protein [Sphingosinicella sp. LHD-64]|uniref:cupin-like domain-containing protein n=1 Tax=Sphingosinicella sp. LHD-64 TaxID=3072139 RepID=UPI00280F584F|nr:cupin-like domain-containing protein [Sphingosinicella sp. LHD-64]MDQ8754610.1 cupin-like domain-containing protein [Sphingosinicella sp. LHD-64]